MTESFDPDKSQKWQVGHLVAGPSPTSSATLRVTSAPPKMTLPNLTAGTSELDVWMDAISVEGWELVGAATLGTFVHLFFKRRLRPA